MIKIEAIIRPSKLDDVKSALDDLGMTGVTISHVIGSGRQRGRTSHYRGQEYVVNLLDKVKIETIVTDDMAESVIKAISDAAYTGEIGDGKIFTYKVESSVRIRTGEKDDAALT